ncbi:MAG: DUF2510 domain-containing protein [Acidimicrobiales bacterium]
MIMASIAAGIWALANVLAGIAFATFSGPLDTTFSNLATASGWLTFGSALVALCAICFVAWSLYLARQWTHLWEVGGASLSTLLVAIGLLVLAAQSQNSTSNAGNVVAAVGLGGWAIVIVVGAARHALLEQENAGVTHQATLRLGAAGAVVLIAVSVGLPNPTINDAAVAIATGALFAVGFAGLLVVLSLGRSRYLIRTRQAPMIILGLAVLVVAGVAHAVGYGVAYGAPPYSLLTFRIALSIPAFIESVALLVLAWAAVGRLSELPSSSPTMSQPGWMSPSAPPTVPPSWQSDPTRRHEVRWWDGVRWTEHVLDGNRPASDPLSSDDRP